MVRAVPVSDRNKGVQISLAVADVRHNAGCKEVSSDVIHSVCVAPTTTTAASGVMCGDLFITKTRSMTYYMWPDIVWVAFWMICNMFLCVCGCKRHACSCNVAWPRRGRLYLCTLLARVGSPLLSSYKFKWFMQSLMQCHWPFRYICT